MPNLTLFAEDLLTNGLSILPVQHDKSPTLKSWAALSTRPMTIEYSEEVFSGAWGIGLICGAVSGGIECIDFDSHGKNIDEIYKQFIADEGVSAIINNNNFYIEKSPSGGIHLIYKFETNNNRDGSIKLAYWDDGKSMIETKGTGGYVIVAPTDGYTIVSGDLLKLQEISLEERNYLHDVARKFNQYIKQDKITDTENSSEAHDYTDPVNWFNYFKADAAKMLLKDEGWEFIRLDKSTGIEHWRRPGKSDGTSATWGYKTNMFYPFTDSDNNFKSEKYYSPFQILTILRFKRNYRSAVSYVLEKYLNEKCEYIRVGVDYYKRIKKIDRYGTDQIELKPWKKDEIKQDHGAKYLTSIPLYDDFTIVPDNQNYQPVYDNCYNLYRTFRHNPIQGSWKWTKILLEHVFGDQYDLGIRYLQALYLHPKRSLPILVLVSKERQTGKTTFINWLNSMFGNNMVNINPEDLTSQFNGSYATSNIIAVEETLIEKSVTVEKLKALATGKFISVNNKFVNPYKVPFFGKIILASNNEDKFARIDDEEIRFFVRKLKIPQIKNHNIEEDMIKEIPAFLYYLTELKPIDWSRDRSGFTPDELQNDSLLNVKSESKSGLYKELTELISEYFLNEGNSIDEFEATPTDIKSKWFINNHRYDISYIVHVIKNEMNLKPEKKSKRYMPFGLDTSGTGFNYRVGKPYLFKKNKEDVSDNEIIYNNDVPF